MIRLVLLGLVVLAVAASSSRTPASSAPAPAPHAAVPSSGAFAGEQPATLAALAARWR